MGTQRGGDRWRCAGNVIPDECVVTINYRYAPSLDSGDAVAHVREVFEGFSVAVVDNAPGALPGSQIPPCGHLSKLWGGASPQVRLDRCRAIQFFGNSCAELRTR